ncbi:uncharacterized protein LOC121504692 isoform X2 [Cheilinus undulatus]|uniref:uncharacterized protein LOC121504692 isoform X2 n=1 Tax=Cheilinus undulatus TaxID=241271 RepID=UPI001BD68007|nr:uncharacterized protein LOC121504692 isoform X2 [Cheilinus undulatus]
MLFGRMVFSLVETTTLEPSPSLHFRSVSAGEDVTLECFYQEGVAVVFYWYKQSLGQKPELLSKFYKHNKNGSLIGEFQNDPRYKLEIRSGEYHLKISKVKSSDSASYYCMSGYSYIFEFKESIILHVKSSGVSVPALVHQSESETIQPGGSVTLSCTVHTETCDGEHSVYWFRNSEEAHPGLIYTHGGRNDQCERNPHSHTHTCVYNLNMRSLNLSHAGTYYCAVVSCGHILFGNGTKLDFEYDGVSLFLVYLLSGALAFTIMLVVPLAFTACAKEQCSGSHARASRASTAAEGSQDADDLQYENLWKNKANRSLRQRDRTWSECVYYTVRQ